MENTNEKQEFEFSLSSLFKIFKGKLKMLVAIGIIAALLGGIIGGLTVVVGKKTYGNTLTFYLPTQEQTGYSKVIPLLESDLFTESILIGTKDIDVTDKDGKTISISIPDLPYSADDEKKLAEYEIVKIQAAENIKEYKTRLKTLPFEINNLKTKRDAASNAFSPLSEVYNRLWTVYSNDLSAVALEKITALENSEEYITASTNYAAAQKAYNDAVIEESQLAEKLFLEDKAFSDANEKSEEIIAKLRSEWTKNPENKKLIENFHKYVTYSFTKDETTPTTNNTTQEDTSGKFLYIDVRIPKDINFANDIINNITEKIGDFIISNTTPVENYDQIQCVKISSGEAKDVNKDLILSTIIKFTLIAFFAAELITCLIIIFSHVKKNLFASANVASTSVEKDEEEKGEEDKDEN